MSADNGIYILQTTHFEPDEPRPIYRVAHAQDINNLEWVEKEEPYNLGAALFMIWSESPVFYEEEAAWKYAYAISKDYKILEYGVTQIDKYKDLHFFGD